MGAARRDEHFRKLERMYARAAINEYFRPKLEIGEGTATVAIDVREDFFHAGGAVHGTVYFKALDDAAFFAANSLVEDVFVLTFGFHLHFTRPVAAGTLTATGRVVHRSSRLLIADATLTADGGKELARGTGSFVRSKFALSRELGYY